MDQPDPALFDTLEPAIKYAHERDGRTHIWAWGDNDRTQTPNHPGDGFRGTRRRLTRYIAARLGPTSDWALVVGEFSEKILGRAERGAEATHRQIFNVRFPKKKS